MLPVVQARVGRSRPFAISLRAKPCKQETATAQRPAPATAGAAQACVGVAGPSRAALGGHAGDAAAGGALDLVGGIRALWRGVCRQSLAHAGGPGGAAAGGPAPVRRRHGARWAEMARRVVCCCRGCSRTAACDVTLLVVLSVPVRAQLLPAGHMHGPACSLQVAGSAPTQTPLSHASPGLLNIPTDFRSGLHDRHSAQVLRGTPRARLAQHAGHHFPLILFPLHIHRQPAPAPAAAAVHAATHG